ncbi:MAG TPA: hypothetical protein VH639_27375 [Bryobacteraceae bacterium]|jgi:hypothetical protein
MVTTTLLLILGLALGIVLWAMFRTPSRGALPASTSRGRVAAANPVDLDPWDAKPGDVVSISGGAEDFSDLDFAVDRRSSYQSSARRWIDLSGEFRGTRVYLEVYKHPQPDLIGILDARKLGLDEIKTTEDALADIDSSQSPSSFVEFEGKQWHWESSREIRYFENDLGNGEGLYRWLFREPEGSRLLCVEKWEGEPFEIRIVRRLNPRDITVYPAGRRVTA